MTKMMLKEELIENVNGGVNVTGREDVKQNIKTLPNIVTTTTQDAEKVTDISDTSTGKRRYAKPVTLENRLTGRSVCVVLC